jgi:hypothetical protein
MKVQYSFQQPNLGLGKVHQLAEHGLDSRVIFNEPRIYRWQEDFVFFPFNKKWLATSLQIVFIGVDNVEAGLGITERNFEVVVVRSLILLVPGYKKTPSN